MPKQPPTQTVSRLRQKAARARGHANLLAGDEAERRLKELADEIDQQAAALGAGTATPPTEAIAPAIAQGASVPRPAMATASDASSTQVAPARTDDNELEQRIRERAYYLWEADGRRPGRDEHYWEQAEIQIRLEPDTRLK